MKRILEVRVNENNKPHGCISIVSHFFLSLRHCLEGNPRSPNTKQGNVDAHSPGIPCEDSEE